MSQRMTMGTFRPSTESRLASLPLEDLWELKQWVREAKRNWIREGEDLSLEELWELKFMVQEARENNAIREINKLLNWF